MCYNRKKESEILFTFLFLVTFLLPNQKASYPQLMNTKTFKKKKKFFTYHLNKTCTKFFKRTQSFSTMYKKRHATIMKAIGINGSGETSNWKVATLGNVHKYFKTPILITVTFSSQIAKSR